MNGVRAHQSVITTKKKKIISKLKWSRQKICSLFSAQLNTTETCIAKAL